MTKRIRLLVALVVLLLAACTGADVGSSGPGSGGLPSSSAALGSGVASPGASSLPSADASALASPGSSTSPDASVVASAPLSTSPGASSSASPRVTTPAAAARLVLATDPRFLGIRPYDPSLIGQAAWYQVSRTPDGYRVVVRIGWGDCPSGCIDEHRWTFDVSGAGGVRLVSETGPAVPSASPRPTPPVTPAPAPAFSGIVGTVTAGPVCPVERIPPDPSCAPRPVAGAVLVVSDLAGREVARATSSATGEYRIPLPAGSYVLTPQPTQGLMGTPAPVDVTVEAGAPATVDIQYDTGIR